MNKTDKEIFAIIQKDIIADPTVSHAEFRVYAALKSFANRETRLAWPSQKQLADRAGMRKADNLRRPLEGLEKKGWIRKLNKGKPGRNRKFIVYEHRAEPCDLVQEYQGPDTPSIRTPCAPLTDNVTNNKTDNLTERRLMEKSRFDHLAHDGFGSLFHQASTNPLSTVSHMQRNKIRENSEASPPFSEREFNDELYRVCNGQQPGMYAYLESRGFYTELGKKLETMTDLENYLELKKRGTG